MVVRGQLLPLAARVDEVLSKAIVDTGTIVLARTTPTSAIRARSDIISPPVRSLDSIHQSEFWQRCEGVLYL